MREKRQYELELQKADGKIIIASPYEIHKYAVGEEGMFKIMQEDAPGLYGSILDAVNNEDYVKGIFFFADKYETQVKGMFDWLSVRKHVDTIALVGSNDLLGLMAKSFNADYIPTEKKDPMILANVVDAILDGIEPKAVAEYIIDNKSLVF